MSIFDPESFMQSSVTGAHSTEYELCPEGDYNAVVLRDGFSAREVTRQDGSASHVLDVPCQIDAPEKEGANQKIVRYSVWLDLNESGGFDMSKGKNVRLGRLREAVGQNDPSRPWALLDLVGQPLRVKVQHSADGKYANVTAVGKVGTELTAAA